MGSLPGYSWFDGRTGRAGLLSDWSAQRRGTGKESVKVTTDDHVSREDIEAELRAMISAPDGPVATARPRILGMAITVGALMFVAAYLIGRRAGRQRSTVVEVRRI